VGRYDRSTTLTDASGDAITVGNPLPVTSTGGGSGGGTSQADKSTFGEGTGIGTPIMGVVNDTLGGLVGEDKTAAVRITPARGFHCNLRDVNGDEIGTAGAPLRTDPTGTTPQPVTGTVTIQDGGGSITIDGTVAATQSGSWTVAATQSGSWSVSITGSVTVANLNTADYDTGAGTATQAMVGIALPASGGPVAGGTSTNPVRTDPTGATAQPVTDGGGSLTVDGSVSISGSVTVTGTVAATQSGTWATQLTDGSLTASVRNTGSNDSLNVAITDASGNQITSFGGGTQYTDGDTDATPMGTLAVWLDTGDTLRAVSAAKPLPVNVISGSSGSVDDSAFGIGTDNVSPAGALFDDTLTDSVDEGDVGLVRMSGTRLLYVTTHSGDPVVVSDGGGSVTIDGSVSITGSVTVTGTVAVTQSGAWTVMANAGTGTFGVNQTNAATADYDTGAGTVTQVMFGVALPASGGPVAGGTATNPLRTDPTGTTAQPVTDNGGSLTIDGSVSISGAVTVTGTVAATQLGTWNVGLNAGSNTIGKVDQGAAGVSAWIVDGSAVTQPVSGTVAATQSGTWNVGLSTGTNSIGDVRSITTSIIPGTSATHLGKAEDAGHVSGDTGVFVLAVRNDTRGTLAGTDLDYAPFQLNSSGDLRVDGSGVTQPVSGTVAISGSVTVTGTVAATQSGTWTVQQGSAPWSVSDGGGSLTVDGPLTDTQLRATPVPVSGTVTITDETGPVTVDGTVAVSGNVTVVQGTATNLKVDASGVAVPVTDNGGSLTVDGALSVSGSVDQGTGGTSAWKVDGSAVTQPVSDAGGSLTVDGSDIGVLSAIANADWPSWTEGDSVSESVDLLGRTRVFDWAVRSEIKNVTGLLMEIRDLLVSERG
jgi:hypothetical protein